MSTVEAKATLERLRPHLEAVISAVLDGPGHTTSQLRRAICDGNKLDRALAGYVGKVRNQAYRVGLADLDALRSAGFSDDALFEITVAASLGEGLRRLRAGLRVLGLEE